jgi:hypothetical protein
LVLGKWILQSARQSKDSVYVIDRGSIITDASRYMQFKIIYVDPNKYILQIANLDGSNIHNFTVQKDPSKAHVYFSFDNNGTYLNFEPEKNNWHFCFLRYRYVYYQFSPPLLYSVTGIFINNHKVQAAIDSTLLFANVNYNNVQQMHFSHNRDAMGFDWKVYNFTNGRYTTRSFVNYIVKSNYPLKYYKIRFIDFYDDNGLKGTPRFEVQGM